jgi:hypothetical protein
MPAKTKNIEAFLSYLTSCGGKDVNDFTDTAGMPDPAAARVFAEALREKWKPIVGTMIKIEQVANRITVTNIAEPALT